jgi:phosphoglycolate phosphatase
MARPFDAVLIDLDGTLLDTAGDLAQAANAMLRALDMHERTRDEVATYIGKGTTRLIHRALTGDLSRDADPALFARAAPIFETHYEALSGLSAEIYPGVEDGLTAFREGGLVLACVTNKPRRFTTPLLERVGLARYFDAIVCGDDVARAKPDPAAFLAGAERLHVAPSRALVIGDSANDVIAGRAAGCTVFVVPYGYTEGATVESLAADRVVASLAEAARYVLEPDVLEPHLK